MCEIIWTGAGIEIGVDTQHGRDVSRLRNFTPDEVAATLQQVQRTRNCDAILLTGTGLQTLAASGVHLLNTPTVPMLTSNLCMAWWIARTLKIKMPPRLAARIPQLI